jgi:hypothetical protein
MGAAAGLAELGAVVYDCPMMLGAMWHSGLVLKVRNVTSSLADTVKRIGVPCRIAPVHSPA